MSSPIPLIVIVGPNAVGKSALAVRLAKRFNGEIISADSRQVYRGLDIGTGKIPKRERRGIRHHLLDVASPHRRFDVIRFRERARAAIKEISRRSKLPFLVGGTGFWVDALSHGHVFPAVPPNQPLRRRLSQQDPKQLLATLRRLDPKRAQTIEQKNPRRLIRAIEIARVLGRVPPKRRTSVPYRILWIGCSLPPHALRQRIRKRLHRRLRVGMIQEAKRLRNAGLGWKRFYELGLEYRFLADYLRKKITRQEMIEGLERANWQYARRQMTWFRRNRRIQWIRNSAEASRRIRQFLAP